MLTLADGPVKVGRLVSDEDFDHCVEAIAVDQ